MNRGLIEADSEREAVRTARKLPRFMNRGLIEAEFPSGNRVSETVTSPIHESGPH